MDKHTKIKTATTVVCLIISLAALYAFAFLLDVSAGWRITLILLSLSWIISGILNLYFYFRSRH